jgi:hypothetical protein
MLLVVLEGSSLVTGKILQRKWGMWRTPTAALHPITYSEYLKKRDPVLGWPYPEQYGRDLDVNGAQRDPYFPNGPRYGSCISLYGDSFTEGGGDTSSPDKKWGNVLSHLSSCYVANFGMGGYGTDQAYLRFEGNRSDPSPVVILGFHTDDVLRNLTRIRDLLIYDRSYALKPRFVLGAQQELKLVPIPDLTEEQYLRVTGIKGELLPLENENFQPGGPGGVVSLEFPYTLSIAKNLHFYGFQSRLLHRPEWLEFLAPGHPLHGLEISIGIAKKFVELAHQRGKTPLVVILPHKLDFAYFQDHGTWPYQTVVDGYARSSLPYLDFGPYLASVAHDKGLTFEKYFGATGHYNDAGNALVGRFVYDWLNAKELIPAR